MNTDLADFVDNPQGITGDIEYCSMVVAFTLLQSTSTEQHSDTKCSLMLCSRSTLVKQRTLTTYMFLSSAIINILLWL